MQLNAATKDINSSTNVATPSWLKFRRPSVHDDQLQPEPETVAAKSLESSAEVLRQTRKKRRLRKKKRTIKKRPKVKTKRRKSQKRNPKRRITRRRK